jgi:large subunit ribosomal protein L6
VSRVGRMPVAIPNGVQIELNGSNVSVKGPKGEMKRTFSPLVGIAMENGQIVITRNSDLPAERALHGTTRAVLANMVRGVSTGFERVLEIEGVGYRAEMNGKNLVLNMAKDCIIWARRSDARLVKPERRQSNLWLRNLVLKLALRGIRACV